MRHHSGRLRTPESKIIILRPVEFFPEAAHLINDTLSHHQKMADVIVGSQKIQIKIRFHIGDQVLRPLAVDLVFIRIDYVGLIIFCDLLHDLVESVALQKIIMV